MNGESNGVTNGVHHAPACICGDGHGGFVRNDVVPKGGGHPVPTYEICPFHDDAQRTRAEAIEVIDDPDFAELDFEDGDTDAEHAPSPRGLLGKLADGWRKIVGGSR